MDASYIGYNFTVFPLEPGREILIAQLGAVGFESFVENDEGFVAYIQEADWSSAILDTIQLLNNKAFQITYEMERIAQTNWNEEWEKNFDPILVSNTVSIRAPFHKKPDCSYDIIIEPKMSFGTGHHETTHMMVQHLIEVEVANKTVLDMGCGTGVLAIFAAMKGASSVDAIDIDNWCYQNSIENISRNSCTNIAVYEGDASLLSGKNYDLIIANINRNILLEDMAIYNACLNSGGVLLLSGFYKSDIDLIHAKTAELNLTHSHTLEKNNWVALKYLK